MTLENQLIKKRYYESWIQEEEIKHPIEVLGEASLEEQRKELYDLSAVRFAQGEVYYHHKDYEAAVFKWENVNGDLEAWARKNMGDAYYEMGLLAVAEEIYSGIETESDLLAAETALQLFSLYLEQHQIDRAYDVIKKLVSLHPDYGHVTALARTFYEEREDWESAVELSVHESIRTELSHWFEALCMYVEKGYTKHLAPNYFYQVLFTLYKTDDAYFERVTSALWYAYEREDSYLTWVKMINDILLNVELETRHAWPEIAALYEETFSRLMEGQHLLAELHEVVPPLLTNWLRAVDPSSALFASAAVFAWSEVFPSSLSASTVKEAEHLIFNCSDNVDGLGYALALCDSIAKWTKSQELEMTDAFKWQAQYLADMSRTNILIGGFSGAGKSAFINSVLGENRLGTSDGTVVIKHGEQEHMLEVLNRDRREPKPLHDRDQRTAENHRFKAQEPLTELKVPSRFLKDYGYCFIDMKGWSGERLAKTELLKHVALADGLLFVIDANEPFTDAERDALLELQHHAPRMPVHFLLNKMDIVGDDVEVIKLMDETKARIHAYFPNAQLLPYSSIYAIRQQLNHLGQFMSSNFALSSVDLEEERTEKLLLFIREMLSHLFKKRVELENGLIDSIKQNEDMLVRLNGFINTLSDLEAERTQTITGAYRNIKEELEQELEEGIPAILHSCSDLVHEDSDIRNLDVELNKKMNERLQLYLQEEIVPKLCHSIEAWLRQSNEELHQAQAYLTEMSDTFNEIYGERNMLLECDLKVLDDWYRDANRMTSRMNIEEENILLRFKPAQFLLKSAGKLLGALPQNKSLVQSQYKRYLESETYEDVTDSIISKFLLELDLFEKALPVDIRLFFKQPSLILDNMVERAHQEIKEGEVLLNEMKENPEAYYDPLTLFELRLRQYELMVKAGKEIDHSISFMER
jgi:tetratricopeptide (TPR) repeat protein/GTP-binding protein EngB required for normal cell division